MKRRILLLPGLCLALAACLPSQPLPAATPLPTAAPPTAAPPPSPNTAATARPAPTLEPSQPPPTPTVPPLTYPAQPGDTLFAIALAQYVTVESLQAANGLEGDTIFPGQVLIIPAGTVVPPTPAASPTRPTSLAVVALTVSPNPVERGGEVSVRWDVPFAVKVTLWQMTYDRQTGRWYRHTEEVPGFPLASPAVSSSTQGEWTGRVPGDARYSFRFELEARDSEGRLVEATSDVVELRCYPSIAGSGYCPFAPQTAAGEYQPFEKGHLLWRGDTGQVLIIPANPDYYLPWSLEQPAPETRPIGEPPAALFPPAGRFAGLWSSHLVQAIPTGAATLEQHSLPLGALLGWATAPEQAYSLTVQVDLDNTQSGILNDHLFVSLPDGRVASLILYNGARGVNGPAWTILEP